MDDEPADEAAVDERAERRAGGDRRRRYNRRLEDRELSPPYFEVFERIAVALETIAASARSGTLTLPDRPKSTTSRGS